MMVRDAVLARIARLSPAARTLLELASIVPTRSERWLLEAFVGSLDAALEECLTAGMLELSLTAVTFRHEIARQAVESTLSPLRQQRLHTQVLQVLITHSEETSQAARLVHHALGASDAALVARYAPLGAKQAAVQGAHREAAALYATALRYADQFPPEYHAELLEGRAYECYLTNQIDEAIQAQLAALRIWQQCDRPEAIGQSLRWLSRFSWMLGKPGEAEQYATEAIHLLETLPPSSELARAYGTKAQLFMIAEDYPEAILWGERTLVLAESLSDIQTLAHALNTVGTAQLSAQNEQGRINLERSLQLALEKGWEDYAARAYCNLVTCAMRTRDYPHAVRYLQKGLAYCTEHDLDTWRTYLMAWQAAVKFEQGDWDEAASEARYVLDQHRIFPATKFWALVVLGWIRVRRGDPGGVAVLDEVRGMAQASGELQRIAPVAAARAETAWLSGDLKRCQAEAHEGYDLALAHTDLWALGELSIWLWRAGELTQAPRRVAEPFARQIAGDWRAAAEQWVLLGCPYEQALALADGDGEAMLTALALLERLGAQPAVALVHRRLRQQGIAGIPRGPRPSTRANQAGLTNRQLEVLQLMVEGLSNAEIASRLITSPKTIESHVSAVLAKLGVNSRAQAVRAAYHMELHPGWNFRDETELRQLW
ncbi:hypothetical protein KSF_004760 [Reticulibacter mediterranei]|uniref:HTH luxR-type domain-containing protein n=1 Tax=Reticulibacter mediterranei TaxID=2778369 RepID=A0A8J3MZG4_9CHLR|nr:LuxR family transcriptional regulator [Reticulibacter mediterranei]GHO90428.1 hypothetical protein KSF_004760 [Reticulibacter mediterranei]